LPIFKIKYYLKTKNNGKPPRAISIIFKSIAKKGRKVKKILFMPMIMFYHPLTY
jgi:hypothetical protein